MKLDIEGLEFNVLKSAEQDGVLKKINAIVTEINPKLKEHNKAIELLSRNGFKVTTKGDIISAIR